MLKLAGTLFNLDCPYLYNLIKQKWPGKPAQWRISPNVLESFITKNIESQNCEEIVSFWQA